MWNVPNREQITTSRVVRSTTKYRYVRFCGDDLLAICRPRGGRGIGGEGRAVMPGGLGVHDAELRERPGPPWVNRVRDTLPATAG